MAANFTLEVRGLDDVIKRINELPHAIAFQLKGEFKAAADEVARNAKRDAPKNLGRLAQTIVVRDTGQLSNEVVVLADYGAFMEWGTKKKVKVPSELSAYAAQFKGAKAGTGTVTLEEAILAWVKRKGVGGRTTKSGKVSRSKSSMAAMKSAAFLIARSIRRNGVAPHPYFFKNVFLTRKKLEQRIFKLVANAGV